MKKYTEEQAKEVLKDFYNHIDGCFKYGKIKSFLDKKFNKVTYSIGDRFKYMPDNEEYILCAMGVNRLGLICLDNGFKWNQGIEVKDIKKVTELEIAELMGDFRNDFITIL